MFQKETKYGKSSAIAIILYYNNIVIREVQGYDSKTNNSKRKKI